MKIGKKFLIYLFCGLLTFSFVSSSYYKTVHAFEYAGGALAFEEALKWLLACLGVTATAGMTDAYWQTYGDDFVDYATQNGATQQEVAEWQLKLCEGVLDKGSVVWSKFKSWVNSLFQSDVSESFDHAVPVSQLASYLYQKYNYPLTTLTNYSSFADEQVYGFVLLKYSPTYDYYSNLYMLRSSSNVSVRDDTLYGSFIYGVYIKDYYNNRVSGASYVGMGSNWDTSGFAVVSKNFQDLVNKNVTWDNYFVKSGDIAQDNPYLDNLDNTDTNNMDVISSDGVNEADDEVALPYPGVSDSDNELSNDAYQDIVDKINDGTITQEEGIEKIQELLRVITYDTVTDEVVPPQKNDDGTNKTKDDALKENKENAGFTLGGLENVFPFCIPFDIYAFMTLLVAEPECPEFDFPIKTVDNKTEEIHVDLEPFEPVAVVVRYVFDFLFIVGLAMLTRSLIGGGSSD